MIKKLTLILSAAILAISAGVAFAAPTGDELPSGSKIDKVEPTALTEDEKKDEAVKQHAEENDSKEGIDVKEIIFHHLGDGYGWEVPFSHVYRIPLPVIVRAEDGEWFCFSSANLTEVEVIEDMNTGEKTEELIPVIHEVERNGKTYRFVIAHVSTHANKVVEIFPLSEKEQKEAATIAAETAKDKGSDPNLTPIDGYINVEGHFYREYRPFDISITKNVLALLIASVLVTAMMMGLVRFYKRKGFQAPRKGMGFVELLVDFVYSGVIKPTLKDKAPKFAPYLLTCFFFILTMNLIGLVVIFPGGANLTGNIAITLVLAVLTFLMTNILGSKHYWKDIFWPDVPIWLKCPLPIMQVIEIFGIFTKPAALCVRLFANMMGGHMIVITLTLLIFIFAAFGAAAAGGAVVISVLFSVFMLLLDVLVSFIQAYVFTTLSTMFISAAQESGHGDKHENNNSESIEESPAKAIKE